MSENRRLRVRLLLQFVRLSLISGLVFIVVMVLGLGIIGWIYRDTVSDRFIEALNRQLLAEVKTESVQLSLFRSFPLASVSFKNTEISKPAGEPLLKAGDIRLEFNIVDILRGDYTVRGVNITDASILLHTDSTGKQNFIIWKASPENVNPGFRFDIRSMQLNNAELGYTHVTGDHNISADIERLRLSGRFEGGETWVTAKGGMILKELSISGTIFPPGKTLEMDTGIEISKEGELYIGPGEFKWNGQDYFLSGYVNTSDKELPYQAHISADKTDLSILLDGLPDKTARKLAAYSPGGAVSFNANLEGRMIRGNFPGISSSFTVENGSFRHPSLDSPFRVKAATGTFSNGGHGSAEKSSLSLSSISAEFDGGRVSGSGSIHNFNTPVLSFSLSGNIPASGLSKQGILERLTNASGRIDLEIDFSGRMSRGWKFTGNDLLSSEISGHILLSEIGFLVSGKPLHYHNMNSKMTFRGNRLEVEHMSGRAGESDFALSGYMTNVLPYLFLNDETLFISADLDSKNINLDELLQAEEGSAEADTNYHLRLPRRLQLMLHADIEALKFRLFRAARLSGNARLEGQRLIAENLNFNTMDGSVRMQGVIDGRETGNISMSCEAILSGVDINKLFYQTGNFGQNNITDQNIHGKLTANMFFRANWSPALEIDWESMETTADLRIIDGRLVNYRPMQEMGRFLRTGDLSDVSFSALENEIHIRDRNIIIPQMEVSSSAINLQLSGLHTFEGDIDYRIQVLLSDLMARNHRERRNPQEQYGDIIDDGLGRTTLFLMLSGTSRNPVFRYDYQGVRQKIADDLREERRNLVNILREEFSFLGRQRADSASAKETERERMREDLRKQEDGEFLIEWEEDW